MTELVSSASLNQGRVCVITLDRDSARNALSVQLCKELIDALHTAETSGARVIVLTGAGSVFSAGADLKSKDFAGELYPQLEVLMDTLRTVPVPIVAAVNGPAIGAGMMLAMACDLRVVASSSYFHLPVGDMAIGVDEQAVVSLESLIGGSRARAMLLAGTRLSPADAVACGFAVAEGDLDEAIELATTIAAKAPLTLRALKMDFAHNAARPYSTAERNEARRAAWESDDFQEVRRAREEKRQPEFKGS
ncbi:Enoyl-CoA hydratase [Corynebacterium camporealensis]|uniref:Enoyl-CoA hydratase/carnithine racemase n=1 Tax=Corynebacterium camporealensis TaxID=161896 RepID=A0A0F6QY67_9CORY|nr:enoyl-CoA hydratase [Corynebacterium camporealensis]AKE39965.1 enoyl-CoA hydratase/carnithine racemase [Corynebacterium camporealensis]AVH89058.1 Enoyl-CoA hydratase [Corynebacterium camporealensis]